MAQNPKPQTLAMVGADAEFPHNAMDGARVLAKEAGLKIVYDKTYPPSDHRLHADRPRDPGDKSGPRAGLLLSARHGRHGARRHEVGLKTKLFGGGMVGLQSTAIKMQLGPLLNGIVDYDFWLPWSELRQRREPWSS